MKNNFTYLALLAIAGCTPIDSTESGGDHDGGDDDVVVTPCTEDFECSVGQICGEPAQGETTRACAAAPSGAQRTFAKTNLSFTSGSEVYLLGVYALPTAASAPNAQAAFALTVPTTGTGTTGIAPLLQPAAAKPIATRVGQSRPKALMSAAAVDAQHLFDQDRRARLDSLIADLRAGRTTVRPAAAKQTVGCASDCGAQMCWKGQCVDSVDAAFVLSSETVSMKLVDVVEAGDVTINVLLDDSQLTSETAAKNAADAFAETLGRELALLGQTGGHAQSLDRDGDGRLTIAFTNHEVTRPGSPPVPITTDIVGLFDYNDFLPTSSSGATGNEADILWARVPGSGTITEELAVGTLVHEYVHLASYALRVHARNNEALREVLWLDEGMAHLMEDLSGWGGSNIANVATALSGWGSATFAGPRDTDEQRGMAMMLLRHFIDTAAKGQGAATAAGAQVTTAAGALYRNLLSETTTGFEHSAFANANRDAVGRFLVGVFATGNPDVTYAGANAYNFLTVASHPNTNHLVGINPFGDSYVDARGDSVPAMEGPQDLVDVDDPTTSSDLQDGFVAISGSALFRVTGGTGAVQLVGRGDAALDLRVIVQRVQ